MQHFKWVENVSGDGGGKVKSVSVAMWPIFG